MVTNDLRLEHQAILSMLDVLDIMRVRLEGSQIVELDDLRFTIRFLSGFVDTCHHAKEELALFPALQGLPGNTYEDRTDELVAEHVRARDLVARMKRSIEDGQLHTSSFLEAAGSYVTLLREHLRKEDYTLFPAADIDVPESTAVAVRAEYERIEDEQIGPGVHEELHRTLHTLVEKYGAG